MAYLTFSLLSASPFVDSLAVKDLFLLVVAKDMKFSSTPKEQELSWVAHRNQEESRVRLPLAACQRKSRSLRRRTHVTGGETGIPGDSFLPGFLCPQSLA